jgi:hypothetical protein
MRERAICKRGAPPLPPVTLVVCRLTDPSDAPAGLPLALGQDAVLAQGSPHKVEGFEELGTEVGWRFEVEAFAAVLPIEDKGRVFVEKLKG